MSDEFQLRQRAVRLRLAGNPVTFICALLKRSRDWFYKWWQRFQEHGADGLHDQSRAPKTSPRRLSLEARQAIATIRDRLVRRYGPHDRYRLAGAATIQHELEILGFTPPPSLRQIDRELLRTGRTNPAFRVRPTVTHAQYPGPQAAHSNHVHQLDLVGPRYLKGSHVRYYFLVYKDAYDQTPYVEFHCAPTLDVVLAFLVRAWQRLGLPRIVQTDNGRLFAGTGRWPGSINRFIRLVLLVGVELVFIPEGEPFRNGSAENFNGWFQERLLSIRLHGPAHVRRELGVLMEVCFQEHVHPHLGFRTAKEVRRSLLPRRLPANFRRHLQPLPIPVGKVTSIRKVRPSGRITVLDVKVHVSKRLKGRYVRATLYTRTARLKIYHARDLVKEMDFPIRGSRRV
jgi:transposase InsO family protein